MCTELDEMGLRDLAAATKLFASSSQRFWRGFRTAPTPSNMTVHPYTKQHS